jgi:predicted kinase
LHLLMGKIAAGKSTLSRELAAEPSTIVLSEDTWLARLFPGEVETADAYFRYAPRIRPVVGPLVGDLLRAGLSVAMDFPANTMADRDWLKSLGDAAGARIVLHWLDVSDAICLARLARRNAAGAHEFRPTVESFHRLAALIDPPTPDEGLEIDYLPGFSREPWIG